MSSGEFLISEIVVLLQVVVSGMTSAWTPWLETHTGGGGASRILSGAEGCILEPTPGEMAALHAGAAYLDLRPADNNDTQLMRTRIPQVCFKILIGEKLLFVIMKILNYLSS